MTSIEEWRQAKQASGSFALRNIVILTGAGISRESGLHTFRDPDGIWATVNVEDVATPRAFARNPERVQDFYNARRKQLLSGEIQPNQAHLSLARLQREWRGSVCLITQNIDDLHERAGSSAVVHMHGELLKSLCNACGAKAVCRDGLSIQTRCPTCGKVGVVRPDVVWFGEMPMQMDEIEKALRHADLFIAIGTSGMVYPAAGFVAEAKEAGARTVELNLESSSNANLFDEGLYGPATRVVSQYVDQLLLG